MVNKKAESFLGKPAKPDSSAERLRHQVFRHTVRNIVAEVIKGENMAVLVKNAQEDPAFLADVGSLAAELGDKVRQELSKRGKI